MRVVAMRVRVKTYLFVLYHDAPVTVKRQKAELHLPVLLDVDRAVVVLFHGRVAVGLVTSGVVARMVH
jgi:hypothetical protein